MMTRSKDWFRGLTMRERVLILIAGSIVTILVAVFLIALPLIDGTAEARDAYEEAVVRHGRIEAKVDSYEAARKNPAPSLSVPLNQVVAQSAKANGLTLESNAASGDGQVSIRIVQADGTALFGWLAQIEAQGIIVDNLNIEPGEGATLTATASLRTSR